jgi:hypothetical protein
MERLVLTRALVERCTMRRRWASSSASPCVAGERLFARFKPADSLIRLKVAPNLVFGDMGTSPVYIHPVQVCRSVTGRWSSVMTPAG